VRADADQALALVDGELFHDALAALLVPNHRVAM